MGGLNRLLVRHATTHPDTVLIDLPASKSICNRLLVISQLSKGAVQIVNSSDAEDTLFLKNLLENERSSNWLGAAGTALRFGLAWAANTPGERILRGTDRLHERPLQPLIAALNSLGAQIECYEKEGHAPLIVNGRPLRGGTVELPASESSQFASALMLIGPYLPGGLEILLTGEVVSAPYIYMTATIMNRCGAGAFVDDERIVIPQGSYMSCSVAVEPDWSAAYYFFAIAALMPGTSFLLKGLKMESIQGDAYAAMYFMYFGVDAIETEEGVIVRSAKSNKTKLPKPLCAYIDFSDCPDVAQTFAALATAFQIPFELSGLRTLRHKETDRIQALSVELQKCGANTRVGADWIAADSFREVKKIPEISTYDDHRMAMAFAPLAAGYGSIEIENPGVVRKSFPGYWKQLERCGLHLE